jgi:aminobenzoyl-glutamate transport protein
MQDNHNPLLLSFLNRVERVGNCLPHPTVIFVFLCLAILGLSWLCQALGLNARHPLTGDLIAARSLVSAEGVRLILANTVSNFTGFAPLGTVLVAMLGVGIAERSGLIGAVLKKLVLAAPRHLLSFIVVLAGVLSSLAADAGYVVLIPLSAIVFIGAGRHPLAGIAAAFAGVSGGFSANLMIGPVDAILAGISTEAARLVKPDLVVEATGNFYFMVISTFLVAAIGAWVTEKLVEPRLPNYKVDAKPTTEVSPLEKKALRYTGFFTLSFIALLLIATVPEDSALRHPDTGSLLAGSPLIKGVVTLIALYAGLAGIIYGKVAGTFSERNSVVAGMEQTMATMAGYLVLMFFAAQFVNYFAWTNLGVILAIHSAAGLKALALSPTPLILCFVIVACLTNLFIGSASAKWAIIAPVFVPMLMILGISPEATQVAFRIGDSVTNLITPLMPYFALVIAFMQRYQKDIGIGSVIAIMLPYSLALLCGWSLLLIAWMAFNLPLGPGAPIEFAF